MNIFNVLSDAKQVFEQGKAIKFSTVLTNVEAGSAMLYGLFSAVILLMKDFGIDVDPGATDIHTMANGWTITASIFYGAYRIATNPAAGVAPKINQE